MSIKTRQSQISASVNYNGTYLFQRINDGTSEDDFFIVALEEAEQMIMCSQANQALCDEAESGRLHGEGSLLRDHSGLCWVSLRGNLRLHLQKENHFVFPSRVIGDFTRFSLGEPRIDTLQPDGSLSYTNQVFLWNTLFPYLRMATLSIAETNLYPQYLG